MKKIDRTAISLSLTNSQGLTKMIGDSIRNAILRITASKYFRKAHGTFLEKNVLILSLGKQPTFGNATTGFPAKRRGRNECRNSILTTHHYPYLGCTPDQLKQNSHKARPIRNTTGIRVVTRHQYVIGHLH